MSATTKTCINCYHRNGDMCNRTGYHWTVEMQYGGRCAPQMKLWEPLIPAAPRRTIWMRVTQYFTGARHGK